MRAALLAGALALLLTACDAGEVARPSRASAPAPYVPVPGAAAPAAGADIRGQSARALIARFGEPRIDLQEGRARKLQFLGPACVLDAYLYAPAPGKEPVATHVDTRQRNGMRADETNCVAALTKRMGP